MEFIKLIKNDHLYEAALFTINGEVMNVIVKDDCSFKPGDVLVCQIDETYFRATVLKTDKYNLFLFVAYNEYPILEDRRKSVRCKINEDGVVYRNETAIEEIPIRILDLSINGIGFKCSPKLNKENSYSLKFSLMGKPILLNVSIKNEIELENELRYGTAITEISEEHYFLLRKYLLTYQLERI